MTEIEKLKSQLAKSEAERDEARQLLAQAASEVNCRGPVHERISVLKETRDHTEASLYKKIKTLQAALAPFAAVSDALQEDHDPEAALKRVTLGDCHAAKAVLGGKVIEVELAEKWWLNDVKKDGEALIRLAEYLAANNLRTGASSVDSAIRAIETLQARVDSYVKHEPGSPGGRLGAIRRFAQEECGHSPFSSRPPELTIRETIQNLRKEVEHWKREEARRRDDHRRTYISWKYYRDKVEADQPRVKPAERDTVTSYEPETFPYPREWELEDSELKRERDESVARSEALSKILETLLNDLNTAGAGYEMLEWLLAHNEPGATGWSDGTRRVIVVEVAARKAREALDALGKDEDNG
jgi:hypothetical protein